jgi:hypothetical protein
MVLYFIKCIIILINFFLLPNEKTDPQQDNSTESGLKLDPEMPENTPVSSQPTRENMQTQLGAGTEENDSEANSSRVRSNN